MYAWCLLDEQHGHWQLLWSKLSSGSKITGRRALCRSSLIIVLESKTFRLTTSSCIPSMEVGDFCKALDLLDTSHQAQLCPTIALHPQLTFYCKFDLNLDLLLSSCGRLILNQYLMKSLCVLSTLNLSKLNIFLLPNCCRITKNLHWCANNHDWWLYEEDPRLNKTYYR